MKIGTASSMTSIILRPSELTRILSWIASLKFFQLSISASTSQKKSSTLTVFNSLTSSELKTPVLSFRLMWKLPHLCFLTPLLWSLTPLLILRFNNWIQKKRLKSPVLLKHIQDKVINNNNKDFQQTVKESQSRIRARTVASERRRKRRARVHRGINRLAPDSPPCNHRPINSIPKSKAKLSSRNHLKSRKVWNFKRSVWCIKLLWVVVSISKVSNLVVRPKTAANN